MNAVLLQLQVRVNHANSDSVRAGVPYVHLSVTTISLLKSVSRCESSPPQVCSGETMTLQSMLMSNGVCIHRAAAWSDITTHRQTPILGTVPGCT